MMEGMNPPRWAEPSARVDLALRARVDLALRARVNPPACGWGAEPRLWRGMNPPRWAFRVDLACDFFLVPVPVLVRERFRCRMYSILRRLKSNVFP
jgi:hypothetical protein